MGPQTGDLMKWQVMSDRLRSLIARETTTVNQTGQSGMRHTRVAEAEATSRLGTCLCSGVNVTEPRAPRPG